MGNWCDNYLTVLGPVADRARFKEKAIGVYHFRDKTTDTLLEEALCFDKFIPTPPMVFGARMEESCRIWRVWNWGTMYGAVGSKLRSEGEVSLKYYFESKECEPLEFFQRIGPDWPTLTFQLHYNKMCGEAYGTIVIRGESMDRFELSFNLQERDNKYLTTEEGLALVAELKPNHPLVEGNFILRGRLRNHPPMNKGVSYLVSHETFVKPITPEQHE